MRQGRCDADPDITPVQPWMLIDTARVPGMTEDLRLLSRGDEFVINLGRELLMGSRMRGSEEDLARLGCARIRDVAGAQMLIGGLGMGFTLASALALLPATAVVTVAELVPAVVAWNRGPLAALSGNSLADPRVSVHEGDVDGLIRAARRRYDAILLDVDNGPEGLTREANDGLYGEAGLHAAWTALRPQGVLCVWSAAPDRAFTSRLRRRGFVVEEVTVRAHGGRGRRHLIWVATRGG